MTTERGGAVVPTIAGVALAAAAYGGVALYLGDRVPAKTTIAGIKVGGGTADEARVALTKGLVGRTDTPVTVTAGARTFTVDPATAGLSVDVDKTIEGLSGFTLSPVALYQRATGGEERSLALRIDSAALDRAVTAASKPVNVPVKEGRIAFAGGKVALTQPVTGLTVSVPETAAAIAKAWPAATSVDAVSTSPEPQVPAAEYARVKKEFADKVVAGPVKVTAGRSTFEVPVASLTPAITFKSAAGRITPAFDDKRVVAAVRRVAQARGVEKSARDASVVWGAGGASVRPAAPGTALKESSIAAPVKAALTSANRKASVATVTTRPKVSTEQARAQLPKGLISTFTTYFPVNPVRGSNIRIAANALNGAYVPQGASFSLNARLGQRTPGKGYQKAPVINNGRLTTDYGGGISQVSTTLFNAIWFSGAQINEYLPHSFYISRYPEGREATISWPDLDNNFTNTTRGGILIRASATSTSVTVSFYGTKTWDVEAVKGPRRNVTKPKTIRDSSPGCVPQAPADGFDVTVTRIWKQNGREVKRASFNTHYIPEDYVICTNPT